MTRTAPGRWTHDHTGDLTVFLIGMRINKPWRLDAWLPASLAMPRMLRELSRDPSSGFLGYRMAVGAGGPVLVQYWRRTEDVYRYAGDRSAAHRPAWAAFNRRARRVPGAVGIWHETYEIGRAESVYVDMPPSGLAAATAARPVAGRLDRAADRLAA
ncbi:DUF4188 domain-containing protein [Blastococcus sp. CCUG 61487]|uniref:DUF4188 domain-containing protein n=1 Tax=Blastococcus sp. CCUG 61487 TaxID=1840703 RepID=UPI0010C06E46|nr:DUF4188 domain-containing protein [Blastococcus sp. CCUG 61487]TKJ34227.1 hypothetical protein A6V29_15295 [Blastococcus sp. CCUG 61487]